MVTAQEQAAPGQSAPRGPEWTVDGLAAVAGLPVRTIREYQAIRVLPPPRRRGRVGIYGEQHLQRLQLIARLKERGYSLAGIRDLLTAWAAGQDLGGVLDAGQTPVVDEQSLVLDRAQLAAALPGFSGEQIAELAAMGFAEPTGAGTFWVAAPSLLRFVSDLTAAGAPAGDVIAVAAALTSGMRDTARALTPHLRHATRRMPDEAIWPLLQRGRGLIAQGAGRMLIHQLGLALREQATSPPDARLAALTGRLALNTPRLAQPEPGHAGTDREETA
jgi:DNA-binding transcriptional MerR regulator